MTHTDHLTRFLLPHAGVRGVHVHLTKTWQDIRSHANYPLNATKLLGQTTAATALLTGHIKTEGRLSIQLRGTTPLRTLFAECTAAGTLRGIVQLAENIHDIPAELNQLSQDTLLAITIENPGLDPRQPQRYQSLVALEAPDISTAFEDYFHQSEQLPTRLLLTATTENSAGLLLQKLPGDEGDDDGWNRASQLFNTLSSPELLTTPPTTLLHRLFHQEDLQLLTQKPLAFGCSCSRERVSAMLQALGPDETAAAAQATGQIDIQCEFCNQHYVFPADQLHTLFTTNPLISPAPKQLQ